MSLMMLMNEIGDDADLLTRNDQWLEREQQALASNMSQQAQQLRAIILARRVKAQLRQRNLVAVIERVTNDQGEMINATVKIVSLPDAMAMLTQPKDELDAMLAHAQVGDYVTDDYDVETSAALR